MFRLHSLQHSVKSKTLNSHLQKLNNFIDIRLKANIFKRGGGGVWGGGIIC